MSFTLEQLKKTAEKLTKERDANASIKGDWPQATFLPDGNHKMRFLLDPDEEVYLTYNAYGYFAKGIRAPEDLPEQDLPENFEHELKRLASKLGEHKMWGKTKKQVFLIYAYLYETDNKSDNWVPGNLYCIVGNWRLQDAFTDFIDTLAKDAPEEVLKTLDPKKAGRIMQVTVVSGSQGKLNIAPTFGNEAEPIKVEDFGYAPLSQSYIREGYNEEKYQALLKVYREEVAKIEAREPAKSEEKPDAKPETAKSEDEPKSAVDTAKDEPGNTVPEESNKAKETETKVEEKPVDTETEEPKTEPAEKATEEKVDPWAKYRK